MSLLEVQHLIDGIRSYMEEDAPRWRLDCSLIWLIVFSTEVKRSLWWVPYDPCGFINSRRIKYRLSTYDHCRIPDIEQYSNEDEWVQVLGCVIFFPCS